MKPSTVSILRLGYGNERSLVRMLESLGVYPSTASHPGEVHPATSTIIVPGVGSFATGAAALSSQGWHEFLAQFSALGGRLLGLCLGAQLLGSASEEGEGVGLGLLDVKTYPIEVQSGYPVPHTGWATVDAEPHTPSWLADVVQSSRFFFSHAYRLSSPPETLLATTRYGAAMIPAIVGKENVLGVQFHPEKSGEFGRTFLRQILRGT